MRDDRLHPDGQMTSSNRWRSAPVFAKQINQSRMEVTAAALCKKEQ